MNTTFKYSVEDTFYKKGGYVVQFDMYKHSQQEIAKQLKDLRANKFINLRTALITVDFMIVNPNTEIYTIVVIQARFNPNGRLNVRKVNYLNISGKYYNFQKASNLFRFFFEILYVCILALYIIVESNQIIKHIKHNFESTKKEEEYQQKKKERQRLRELKQKRMQQRE